MNRGAGVRASRLVGLGVLAALAVVVGIGYSAGSGLSVEPKSASQAIADMDRVLGDPEVLINNAYSQVEDFIKNHIGGLAIATAFSIGIRSIVK